MIYVAIRPQVNCITRQVYPLHMVSIFVAMALWIFTPISFAGIDEFNRSVDKTLYKLASEKNDMSAQYLIGRKYYRGKYVSKDIKKSIEWFKRAAQQGYPKAQYQLGVHYFKGIGVRADKEAAYNYYMHAADSGLPEARYALGLYYLRGNGGKKNIHKAAKWLKPLAAQRYTPAEFTLGKMYLDGHGIKRNKSRAIRWLRKAAKSGHVEATKLISAYKKKKQLQARSERAFNSKDTDPAALQVQLQLGIDFLHGDNGLRRDTKRGATLVKLAAYSNYGPAQYQYGSMLAAGLDLELDLEQAVRWLSSAADAGVEEAKSALKIVQVKLILSNESKYGSNAEDQFKIANEYMNGEFLAINMEKAFDWHLRAAKQEYRKSQFQIGKMYYEGIGVDRDLEAAKLWLTKATKGNSEAGDLLQKIGASETAAIDIKQDQNVEKISATLPIENWRELNPADQGDLAAVALRAISQETEPNVIKTSIPTQAELAADSSILNGLVTKANLGNSEAQYLLSEKYRLGNGVGKDVSKGLKWLNISADNQNIKAQLQLGSMLLKGTEIEKNYKQAYHWINLAAQQGDVQAQLLLGDIYKKGLGVKKSNSKAIKWYRKSANHGNSEAKKRLGGCRVC